MADKNNSRAENTRKISYHFYLQSDEDDDFGGFLPVETTLEELYPPVCHSCNEEECWLFGYLILLFLFSCGAIGLGVFVFVWEIIQDTNERFFLELLTPILALILAFVAGILWLVSIVGCVGTVKQSTKLLRIITIVFKALLLFEIALSALAFYYQARVKVETDKFGEWMSFIQHYHEDPNLRFTLDSIQTRLGCCGFNGYEDWKENSLFSCSFPRSKTCFLPVTCCDEAERQKRNCEYKILRSNTSETLRQPEKFVHTKGCLTIIQDWYKYNLLLISISCILLAVVQVIAIFAIKRLLRRITNENVEECSVATEQELIPLQEELQDETSPTEVHEEIRARNTSVVVQRIHTLKVVLRAVVAWSGMHSTKEENI
ncbi:tetraspanin-14-like [Oculina patagonica]